MLGITKGRALKLLKAREVTLDARDAEDRVTEAMNAIFADRIHHQHEPAAGQHYTYEQLMRALAAGLWAIKRLRKMGD